jgi:citrate synthase
MFLDQVIEYLTDKQVYSKKQQRLFHALASVFIEFPIDKEPPSSAAVALASNCGASLPNALAAGLNCISDQHLPIQQIAHFISDHYQKEPLEILSIYKDRKIPGFGHPSIKGEDNRVSYLITNFADLIGHHTNFCMRLEEHMPVTMNIGCVIASLSLDNGIEPHNCLFLPLMGRMFGWLKLHNKTKNQFNKVVPSFENISHEHKAIPNSPQSPN